MHRASELTNQLLTFARQGPLELAPVNIDAMIHEVLDLFKRTVDKRHIVHLELASPGGYVTGDAPQLHNALLNVLLNARDAMPNGGELHVSTEHVEREDGPCGDPPLPLKAGSYLRVSVRDQGMGMTDTLKRRIFEPFFTTKPQGKGVGMGLSAVFGVIKGHHGALMVTSEPGQGSVFTLELPCTSALPKTASPTDQPYESTSTLSGKHILLIDDEELVLSLVTEFLEFEGAKVHAYSDGHEALTFFQTGLREIDVVVLDMIMPKMHGRDVLVGLRKLAPNLPIIVCSGYSDPADMEALKESGDTTSFVSKPYQLHHLAKTLEDVMSKASTENVGGDG